MAKQMISDADNEIFYSTASIWEISVKHTAHPNKMRLNGSKLSDYCQKAGYRILPIRDHHTQS